MKKFKNTIEVPFLNCRSRSFSSPLCLSPKVKENLHSNTSTIKKFDENEETTLKSISLLTQIQKLSLKFKLQKSCISELLDHISSLEAHITSLENQIASREQQAKQQLKQRASKAMYENNKFIELQNEQLREANLRLQKRLEEFKSLECNECQQKSQLIKFKAKQIDGLKRGRNYLDVDMNLLRNSFDESLRQGQRLKEMLAQQASEFRMQIQRQRMKQESDSSKSKFTIESLNKSLMIVQQENMKLTQQLHDKSHHERQIKTIRREEKKQIEHLEKYFQSMELIKRS